MRTPEKVGIPDRSGVSECRAAWSGPRVGAARRMGLARIAEEFAEAAERAETTDALSSLLDAFAREIGFRYFALTHHVDIPRAPQPAVRLHNYPPGWVDWFDAQGLGPSDPVHRASHLTSVGFSWSRVPRMIALTDRDRRVLARARREGLGAGFTVPAHVPGESAGSCSFAAAAGVAPRRGLLALAQVAGAVAFERARRICGMREFAQGRRIMLTERQRDCVFWAARGKSDWEISQILGIAHETVIQHLKQARERYGVGKRTQLAVHALFDGTLTFVDLLKR